MTDRFAFTVLRARLQAEHKFVSQEFVRDSGLRRIAKLCVFLVLLGVGLKGLALGAGFILFVSEIVASFVVYRQPRTAGPAPSWAIYVLWGAIVLSTIGLSAPAILVAQLGSFPMYVSGQLWALGLMFFNAQNYSRMPLLNDVTLFLLAIVNVLTLIVGLQTGYSDIGRGEALFVFICLGLYMGYAATTLLTHRRLNDALQTARRDANLRLTALEHASRHDELTGLLNRRSFDEGLAGMMRGGTGDRRIWVIMMDLNDFKPINDAYSHDAGDAVLCEVARRLERELPADALIARMAGDEFIAATDARQFDRPALSLLNQIEAAIAEPMHWEHYNLRVTAAIGLAENTKAEDTVKTICTQADHAMFRAKGGASNSPVIFSAKWAKRGTPREQRRALIAAIENDEITPYFQPKVSLSDGTIIGFEALSRWEQSNGQILLPGQFLPWIDELGLSQRLVSHVARRVCHHLQAWQDAGLPRLDVSINVPEATLATISGRDELLDIITGKETGRDVSSRMTIEITEDVFIARSGDIIRDSIDHLRAAGCRFSLDDFGTGYASLRHLREFRFDEIKIDRTFTAGLGSDQAASVLVESLLTVARGLNLKVIAEGVESEEQRVRLLAMGCDTGQGFLWRRAMPGDEVPKLFDAVSGAQTVNNG